MPVGSAPEVSVLAHEWPRNNATDPRVIGVPSRDPANLVEAFDCDDLFMCRNLQNGIRRGVEDRITGADVLAPELLEYRCAAAGVVADELNASVTLDSLHDFIGESI